MFITTIHSIDSLEKLKRAKADAVIIGVEHYSIRSSITVKKEDLQLWKKKCKKLGLKLYINFLSTGNIGGFKCRCGFLYVFRRSVCLFST